MAVTAIVGANWGDEGKGKMTDHLAEASDVVVRFQGGSNAGHTIINHYGKSVLHMLPSGIFHSNVVNVLGPGVAFDMNALLKELEELRAKGITQPNIKISDRAQVLLSYHKQLDIYEEKYLGKKQFGSTQSGIAPFYADKYAKLGIQLAECYDQYRLKERLAVALSNKNILLRHKYDTPEVNIDDVFSVIMTQAEQIKPFVSDTTSFMHQSLKDNKKILIEGQLGALRDPDHGIYPYSTSSSPLAGFAAVGAGLPPHVIGRIIAVTKSYSTCVGAGPFVTEIFGEDAQELREKGGDAGEYGAKTGRPRRIGWFDAVATRYGCRVQGATEVALTMLDVMSDLDKIPICTAYDIDGTTVTDFPPNIQLEKAMPIYKSLPGWKKNIAGVKHFSQLPRNAQRFISEVQKCIGVPITLISTGPRREDLIQI